MTNRAEPTLVARAEPLLPGRLAPEAMYPADDPTIVPRFVRLRSGLRLRVLECGDPSGPPVLLLHGWCCSAFTFRRNLRALAERGCRVVVADLKGHGLSDKPRARGEYTLARMADHVVELMDAVEMPRATLVGHSMGGALAVAVALRHPGRVSRLALLAPVGFGAVSLLGVARRITPRVLTPLLPHLLRRWMVGMVLRLAYARDAQITRRDVDEYFAPTQFPSYVRAMRDLLHDFEWAPGRREDLERLAAPTLVLYGTRDLLVWRPSVEALVRSIPHVRFEIVEGAGHVLPEEVPELVNARLAEFVGAGEERHAFVAVGGTTS
jgi:4,5:9,10-diseco-3-hydroxy-5,9,17-trioxoandrosta-1(10),2-diene-4-oate hydrolase